MATDLQLYHIYHFQHIKIATVCFHSLSPVNEPNGRKQRIAVVHKSTFFQLPCINVWLVEVGDPAGIKLLIRLFLSMRVTS